MKPVKFHPEAQSEMSASARYYEEKQVGLGKRFLESVYTAIRRVCLVPSMYQRVVGNVQICNVERFPFGVIFREEELYIGIIAVIHYKRRPGYWKDRVEIWGKSGR